MLWRGRRQSDNVEDDRDQGGYGGGVGPGGGFRIPVGGASGGLSLSGIIIIVVIYFVLKAIGIDPMMVLDGGEGPGPGSTQISRNAPQSNDEMKQFVATVLAETEDTWSGIFQANGLKYEDPKLVLFTGQTRSGCGFASAASGPFYCPEDRKVYLDLSFYNQLDRQFGASGDFAQAYVLAHEVGHHVQNLLGILPKVNRMRQSMSEEQSNAMSVRVELQADCFAGIWGHYTGQKGLLEKGDLEEALNAAKQIGDDTLQRRSQGYVVPETFNHGTSAQRMKWFKRGFDSGKVADCDTFNNQP
ncbi:KPN_02809 family neutral zinc metallopeptidase [Pseudaminobacter soli (ex Li et al. 2025)]|uniref:Flagellar biosynthesis protein FlgM n=1 Tax=Pseudaminobacter soli (ex Li et al. 2025) TaxID=1295366 RepID=A0A2P7S729_9HYPH|nr:neutral zinc metallopeptidase [Mesorhizobium soli]PSJ58273.1 flagellar biosynthesis protein FlgM [Mesorhizobium soli]